LRISSSIIRPKLFAAVAVITLITGLAVTGAAVPSMASASIPKRGSASLGNGDKSKSGIEMTAPIRIGGSRYTKKVASAGPGLR
jgi:hypothetical protein